MNAEVKSGDGTIQVTSTDTKQAIADNRSNVKLMWIVSPIPPAKFKKVSFKAPELGAADGSVESLWDQTEDSGVSGIGFALELEFGIGKNMAIAVASRYRAYRDFTADSDYDRTNGSVFARADQKATALGGWLDFYFLQIGGPFFVRLGTGLDIDMSAVVFKSDQLSDSADAATAPIGDAALKLSLLSLRVPIQLNYFLGPVGLSFSLIPVIPFAEFGKSSKALLSDSNTSKLKTGDGEADLIAQLDHKKASFGLEVALFSIYFAF